MTDEVTLFITSCERPSLLRQTIESFITYNTYKNIKEVIIIEDSGKQGINDFVKEYFTCPLTLLYNEKRLGQMASMERAVPFFKTQWIFHCEEDWEFFDYGFIEKSLEILKMDPKISMVFLRDYNEYFFIYNMTITEISDKPYNLLTKNGKSQYSYNPGLRRVEMYREKYPYTEGKDDEGTIQTHLQNLGYISVVTKNSEGYVVHLGWDEHVY
jgi:hypothetical protein